MKQLKAITGNNLDFKYEKPETVQSAIKGHHMKNMKPFKWENITI